MQNPLRRNWKNSIGFSRGCYSQLRLPSNCSCCFSSCPFSRGEALPSTFENPEPNDASPDTVSCRRKLEKGAKSSEVARLRPCGVKQKYRDYIDCPCIRLLLLEEVQYLGLQNSLYVRFSQRKETEVTQDFRLISLNQNAGR